MGGSRKSDKIVYRDLSYRVMDAVFEVHNSLGPGFVESVYEEALAHELEIRGIPFDWTLANSSRITSHFQQGKQGGLWN